MPESVPQSKCPHCGYPIEIGEHALDCPNRADVLSSAEGMGEAEGPMQQLAALETERTARVNDSRVERAKRTLRRWAEIGIITWASLAPLNSALAMQRVARDGHAPQPIDGVSERVPLSIDQRWQQSEDFVEHFEQMMQELHDAQSDLDYLRDVYADTEYAYMLQQAKDNFKRQVLGEAETPPEVVTGFEGTPYESEETGRMLRETFPQYWVSSEIDSVIYRSDDTDTTRNEAMDQYNLGEGWITEGRARGKESGATSIDLYSQTNIYDLLETYSHEIGHVNDWERDNQLSIPERAQLLAMVTRRFLEGENVYMTEYVASINNEDPSAQLYDQVTEYWAEACGAYFSNPQVFAAEYPEDYALVDGWVKRQSPDFDPIAAAEQRDEFVQHIATEHQRQAWESLPESARAELEQLKADEVVKCYASWEETMGLSDSQELVDAIHKIVDAYEVDFDLIYNPLVDEVFQTVGAQREEAVTSFTGSLTDVERASLSDLRKQLQNDPEAVGGYRNALTSWAAEHHHGSAGILYEYMLHTSS